MAVVQEKLANSSTALARCTSPWMWVYFFEPPNHFCSVVMAGLTGAVQVELARPLGLRVHVARVGVQHFTTLDTELAGDGGALSVAGWRW